MTAMTPRQRARLRVLQLLVVTASVVALVFALLSGDDLSRLLFNDFASLAVPLAYGAVGAVLAARLPDNSVGWLCLSIGLVWSVVDLGDTIATWGVHHDRFKIASWAGVVDSLWLVAVGLTSHLALRLPTGELLSRRWLHYSRLLTIVIVVALAAVAVQPGRVTGLEGTQNPLGVPAMRPFGILFVLLILGFIGSISSLFLRYRRAETVVRLQIRWIALGGSVILVVGGSLGVATALGVISLTGGLPVPVVPFDVAANMAIPLSIGIAVTRYRLYDIDVVINRALVYGLLTATLATTYVASVVLLQLLLDPLTRDSSLATAASTLAVAAAFGPARTRIQGVVDHRFYRRKYDAARTLDAFQERLRNEVDLVALSSDLRTVADETMQPAHVSLWLRDPR